MQPTSEFHIFAGRFIQDIQLIAKNMDELMRFVLSPLKGDARTRLKSFLGDLLYEGMSDEELQRLWHATPADIYFHHAHELRLVLREAYDRL